MSSFTSDLVATHLGSNSPFRGCWRLERDLVYCYDGHDAGVLRIIARKGFITDGGSFYNALVPLLGSQTGLYFESYVIHDALARRPDLVSWSVANRVLRESLEVQGMSAFRRWMIHWVKFGSPTRNTELLRNAEKYVEIDEIAGADAELDKVLLMC